MNLEVELNQSDQGGQRCRVTLTASPQRIQQYSGPQQQSQENQPEGYPNSQHLQLRHTPLHQHTTTQNNPQRHQPSQQLQQPTIYTEPIAQYGIAGVMDTSFRGTAQPQHYPHLDDTLTPQTYQDSNRIRTAWINLELVDQVQEPKTRYITQHRLDSQPWTTLGLGDLIQEPKIRYIT